MGDEEEKLVSRVTRRCVGSFTARLGTEGCLTTVPATGGGRTAASARFGGAVQWSRGERSREPPCVID
eukprot:COSAG02_NODE_37996_length_435_cov_0.425595_1_plen_67_part_10